MNEDQKIVEKAVKLSLIEVVIGSTIHALHIPFGGHFMSLNQGLFLTRFLRDSTSRFSAVKMVMEVSSVTSIMKALAPVGKKLGPMISISMQGFLYMLGILSFGRGLFGQMLGMALLSVWAFIQPLITFFIIYGQDLTSAIAYFNEKQGSLLAILYWVIAGKAIVAALVPLVLRFISDERIERYEDKLANMTVAKKKRTQTSAWRELFRPMFLLSLALMITYFSLTGESAIAIFWKCLRALAIAFIIFYLARNPYVHKIFAKLATKNRVVRRLYDLSVKAAKLISNS